MKYTERKKVRVPSPQKQRSTFRVHLIRGLFLVFCAGVIGSVIYYSTRAEVFTIRDVEVTGGETIPHDVVESKVRESLQGTYAFLIPHSFSFLYPEEEIIERVSSIPRIYGVTVRRNTPTSIAVSFSEYMPHALWCTGDSTEGCSFIDTQGFAYAKAPGLLGGALVRHTTSGAGDQFLTAAGLSTDTFMRLDHFIKRFETDLGIRISEVSYKEHGDIEFMVSGGGSLYATLEKDLDAQFTHLASVLASKEFSHIKPGNFNYIDIRFETKVFVNETFATDTASTTATSTDSP